MRVHLCDVKVDKKSKKETRWEGAGKPSGFFPRKGVELPTCQPLANFVANTPVISATCYMDKTQLENIQYIPYRPRRCRGAGSLFTMLMMPPASW